MLDKSQGKAHRSTKTIAILIAVAVIVGSVCGALYAVMNTRLFEEKPKEILDSSPNGDETDQMFDTNGIDDETINFLILGTDESDALTDVMMIARLDTNTGAISVLQVPRDTYVGDDVVITGKINAVYGHPDKGETSINTLKKVIRNKLKINIDHYATITLEKFKEAVDILGGVPVDIKQDIFWDENTTLKKGEHLLSGTEAEMFIRYRKGYATGDIGRMSATKQFMESLIDMMFNMSGGDAIKVAGSCYDKITTDMTINEILKLYNTLKKMDKNKIEFLTIPGDGIPQTYNGYAIYAVDIEAFVEILNEYFVPEKGKKIETDDVDMEDVYVIKRGLEAKKKTNSYQTVPNTQQNTNDNSDSSYWDEIEFGESGTNDVPQGEGNGQIDENNTGSSSKNQDESSSKVKEHFTWWNEDGSFNSGAAGS